MALPAPSRRRTRWLAVAILAVLVAVAAVQVVPALTARVAGGIAPADGTSLTQQQPDRRLSGDAGPLAATGTTAALASTRPAPTRAAATSPADTLTAAERDALDEALRDHPQRDAERARITALMAYRAEFERYRDARDAADAPAARSAAAALLAGLPERVARGEVVPAEARRLQGALLETLHPDEVAARGTAALDESRRLDAALPASQNTSVDAASRDARYAQAQTALLAAWQSEPAARRDARALEARLESLRRSVYDPPGSASPSLPSGATR